MAEPNSISLNSIVDSVQDFEFLKRKGIEYIESITSQLWSDYNTHDPGITILDMLCYAITDLASRSQMPIEDIIAETNTHSFFSAAETLPNRALTATDFRKILLDLLEIYDAAVLYNRSGEVSLYFDQHTTTTTSFPTDTTTPISLKGLCSAPIDLTGQLNEDWLERTLVLDNLQEIHIQIYFDPFENVAADWLEATSVVQIGIPLTSHPTEVEDPENPSFINRYYTEVDIHFSNGIILSQEAIWVRIKEPIPDTFQALNTAIKNELRSLFQTVDASNPFSIYKSRLVDISKVKEKVAESLQANRNLSEDWRGSFVRRVQQVGICIDSLEIAPNLNREEVVGKIYLEIDQFLSPFFQPQALQELLKEEKLPEHIFEGPLLTRGFLTDDHLQKRERGGKIYTSDILAIIMNIEINGQKAIKGVSGLELISYINRYEVARGVKNCLLPQNPEAFKIQFSPFHSKVTVSQPGYVSDRDESRSIGVSHYYILKEELERTISSPGVSDIPIKLGKKREIGEYYSIQHDFPSSYKLREGALTDKDTPLRTAQSRQLKAYLLFFEQFFADYCSQLARLQELFSIDPSISRTYFFQPLNMVPEVAAVIEDEQVYEDYLDDISESHETFLQRRHKMVDHLLARLGEDFSSYAAQAYQAAHDYQLLQDKLGFLNDYTTFAGQRMLGFNYCRPLVDGMPDDPPDVWDTTNVSGFEKRICRLLGIPDYRRRNLADTGHAGRNGEGMHLVEHILLRPKDNDYEPISPSDFIHHSSPPEGNPVHISEYLQDIYSCQISIIMPGYTGRFRDRAFRPLVEKMIRMELPAHLFAYIIWVEDAELMFIFEAAYKPWLEALCSGGERLRAANDALIEQLRILNHQHL